MLSPAVDLQPFEALFGPLQLHAGFPAPGGDWSFRWLAAGSTIGRAVPVDEVVAAFVANADVVVSGSPGNRELTVKIQIIAGDPIALARGEMALFEQCERQNTLTIRPPHAAGVPAVFEVANSHLEYAWDDVAETRLVRVYTIELSCAPYTRSPEEVLIPALAQAAVVSTTTISNGTSATNWTGTTSTSGTTTAVTSSGGQLRQTRFSYQISTGPKSKTYQTNQHYVYSPAVAIDFTGKPYLAADCYPPETFGGGWSLSVAAFADGVALEEVSASLIAGTDTGYRYRWACPDNSVSKLELRFMAIIGLRSSSPAPGDVQTWLDNVIATNQTSTGTGRETLRAIDVGGSAPTQGSLYVTHATDALGDTLLYTFPDTGRGYRPDLRRWRTDGPDSIDDPTTISGQLDDITTETTYAMPVSTLPAGPIHNSAAYVLVIYARGGTGRAIIEWSIDGVTGTTYPQVGVTSAFIPIAGLVLPDIERGPLSADTIDVSLRSLTTGGAPSVLVDQAYLCYLDEDAGLTIVSDVPRNLWADAATLEHPLDAVWIGDEDDETDKIAAGVAALSRKTHRIKPGRTGIFTATSGAAVPEISASLFLRWHTWPAE